MKRAMNMDELTLRAICLGVTAIIGIIGKCFLKSDVYYNLVDKMYDKDYDWKEHKKHTKKK